MTPADWWVFALGVQEAAIGCLYLRQGDRGAGGQWVCYGLACLAWALRRYW